MPAGDLRARRRQQTRDEALDHAVAIMGELGVGGLSVSEVARRLGIRGPSLYKHFPSLHALYDALFARGLADSQRSVHVALDQHPPGVDRLRAGSERLIRWAVANPALAQLLFWRPVPGFEPSPETFAASEQDMQLLREQLQLAVNAGELRPEASDDDAVRLLTVLMSGVLSQHLANQPTRSYESGDFTRLTRPALDLFFAYYAPTGGPHAAPEH
ncbi:MAG: TetR/AcrR family transcriptional regulator [Actinomycetota bacterium]|nr:TetR/AcrR family transcriptional regulator [Actinomycetota bacterium]